MESTAVVPADIDWPTLPRRWRSVLIPAELPGLAREIVSVIRQQIPEYRRSLDGPYGRATRRGVEEALTSFVAQVTRTGELAPAHLEFFRSLGRQEASEGRTHDGLQSAYRIGAKLAWRRIIRINDIDPLPPATVAGLAAAVFAFIDQLAAISAAGYAEARVQDDELDLQRRLRLLQLLVQPVAPAGAVAELAGRLDWPLPAEVAIVDVTGSEDLDDRQLAELARAIGGRHCLGGRVSAGAVLLIAGPLDGGQREAIQVSGRGSALSVGCSVPLARAAASLRWAQLLRRLVSDGRVAAAGPVFCDDHLSLLLLYSEPALHEQLVKRRLGPLAALSPGKRVKYGRLLSEWLESGCSQAELAAELGLHRQTVHYQFSRLAALFGDQLREPQARVELLLALRAALPAWESELFEPA